LVEGGARLGGGEPLGALALGQVEQQLLQLALLLLQLALLLGEVARQLAAVEGQHRIALLHRRAVGRELGDVELPHAVDHGRHQLRGAQRVDLAVDAQRVASRRRRAQHGRDQRGQQRTGGVDAHRAAPASVPSVIARTLMPGISGSSPGSNAISTRKYRPLPHSGRRSGAPPMPSMRPSTATPGKASKPSRTGWPTRSPRRSGCSAQARTASVPPALTTSPARLPGMVEEPSSMRPPSQLLLKPWTTMPSRSARTSAVRTIAAW